MPHQKEVMKYIADYARHFDLLRYVRLGEKVVRLEYVGVAEEEMGGWKLWGGTGQAFAGAGGGPGVWHVTVQRAEDGSVEVQIVDFVVLCLGRFCDLPNIPSLPNNKGPEVFDGKVMHSMEIAKVGSAAAADLIKGKRVVIVGYLKSALDVAAECSNINDHSFFQAMTTCLVAILPYKFYEKVEEGSIVLKQSKSFEFCKEGIIVEGDSTPIKADLVIFGTGFKGDQKLIDIFASPLFQNLMAGCLDSTVPLYRECIHPRIPQMAVVGYSESLANLYTSEMRARWVAHFLDGGFRLPRIDQMEKDVTEWEKFMKRYLHEYYRRSSIGTIHIWYNDHLCKDIGCNPKRKKGFLANLFLPYGPLDYVGVGSNEK
ncbi:Putative flavin-containing monooxygenase 2 [Dendrobium catenatum]|uniref:Flavin-containing monooxygenase n=1 Tax=Dendrobium catenatum TaxID=906689 RepID=A0A2I0WKH2_9ASPA|nr:Putative flavin-containing monooxygenase 2 [Dendrobium catenatum]